MPDTQVGITTTILYRWTRHDVSLVDALADVSERLTGAPALLYSATAAHFAVLGAASSFIGHDGHAIESTRVFEARVFNEDGELRWWNDPDANGGRAAWLSEEARAPGAVSDGAWIALPACSVEPYPNRYVLWGEPDQSIGAAPENGWTRLSTKRIGTVAVPHGIANGERGTIETVEYVGDAPGDAGATHGNAVVIDERLIRIGNTAPGA